MPDIHSLIAAVIKSPGFGDISAEDLAVIKKNYEGASSEQIEMIINKITAADQQLEQEREQKAEYLKNVLEEARVYLKKKEKEQESSERQAEEKQAETLVSKL